MLELVDFAKLCNGDNVVVANECSGLAAIEVASVIQKEIMEAAK